MGEVACGVTAGCRYGRPGLPIGPWFLIVRLGGARDYRNRNSHSRQQRYCFHQRDHVPNSLSRARISRSIHQRAISGRLSFASPSRTCESLMRSCRDARIIRGSNSKTLREADRSRFARPDPSRAWYARCIDLEAHQRENDVRQRQECERHTGQFAEQTVLRDTIGSDSLGLLPYLLKACESLINRGSSHFSHLPSKFLASR